MHRTDRQAWGRIVITGHQTTLDKGTKDNAINYITGMLDKWANNKLKTVVEVEVYEQKYWNENKSKKDSKQKKGKLPK